MELTPTTAVVLMLVFASVSFFFALAESALFSLRPWKARQIFGQVGERGRMVQRLLDQPQDLLATIVLCNTTANAGLVAVVLWLVMHQDWPMAVSMAGLLGLILIGCEVVPKTLAVRAPERFALSCARPMLLIQSLTHPLRRVAQAINTFLLSLVVPHSGQPMSALTDSEYHELLDLAHQQGTLARTEKEIILQIISLDRRTVREVMRPRARMACIPDDLSVEEMLAAARKFRYRRLPMYDETPDTIVGVLNTQALLFDPHADLADVIEFPSFVPESMNLLQLLQSLQRQHRRLAIVLDEFGGTAGLVTMGDILEEVIGKISSEELSDGFVMEKLGEGRWRVNGTMRLDDFRREYPALGVVPEVETMGGLLTHLSEVVPVQGQAVQFRGLRLVARVSDERRVRELLVELAGKEGGRST